MSGLEVQLYLVNRYHEPPSTWSPDPELLSASTCLQVPDELSLQLSLSLKQAKIQLQPHKS